MGVPGLWDILFELGRSRSLVNLSVQEGFEGNRSGRRAYRIGVDASLWYAHAAFAKGGENPELRLLFFRCLQLARLAVVPYFVFDGRERPPIKRGSKKGKAGSHALTPGFKKLLECFGWTWREAPGEAEAELAYLNREGIIDAVLTDDGDALIFGATMVIRNQSNNLTGNKSKPALDSNKKASKDHVMIFTESALMEGGLDRAGLILVAMLCGGDYVQEGIKGFGRVTAAALARAGFGQGLLNIYALRGEPEYARLMAQWRSEVHNELRTNSQGFLKHKHPSLELPATFPDLKILGYYFEPKTSRGQNPPQIRDSESLCLPRLAAFCEKHFGEWGYEGLIIKRFRTLVWESTLQQLLRRAALQVDERERQSRHRNGDYGRDIQGVLRPAAVDAHGLSESFITRLVGRREEVGISDAFVNRPTSSANLRPDEDNNVLEMKVVGNTRKHASTDGLLEYRVEFTPSLFVELTRQGISGKRGDPPPPSGAEPDPWDIDFGPEASRLRAPKESSKPPPPPESSMRVWVCAAMLEQVFPNLLEEAAAKQSGKKKASSASQRARQGDSDHLEGVSSDVEALGDPYPPPVQHTTFRASQPIRRTESQPVAGPSRIPDHQAATALARSPLQPTQPRERTTASLESHAKIGFKFTFPYTDDPNRMLLEDGLDMPLASSARRPRTQVPSALAGPEAASFSQPFPRASPPRVGAPVRRSASEASRPSAYRSAGSRPINRDNYIGFDVSNMFGGGDTDEEGGDETEPDVIRNASAATNNRMDHIFDAVFKPRGKEKGKATAKRVASAPTASQSRPVKKRKTAQSAPRMDVDWPPLAPPPPRRVSPPPVQATYRNSGLVRQNSIASSSRASSDVIEIDSDSDNDSDNMFPTRLSSPPSTRFDSDEESIIDLT